MMKTMTAKADLSSSSLFDQANEAWEAGNLTAAFSLLNASVSDGDKNAFNSLGYFFDYGLGVPADSAKALYWYKKAAQSGEVCAYANIGLLYLNRGNLRQAKFWLGKAIEKGDGDAALEMAKLFLGTNSKRNRRIAVSYLKAVLDAKSTVEESIEEATRLLAQLTESERMAEGPD